MNPSWQAYVEERFPAYLFPSAQQAAISTQEAMRFLRQFSGDDADLDVVTTASLFADPEKRNLLETLVNRTAPELARNLPSTTRVESRLWDGAYRGRLDVAGTLAFHSAGQPTRFVTRDRRRTYDLPQTILLRATLQRLLNGIRKLRERGIAKREQWGELLLDAEPRLRGMLARTPLQHVPLERITATHTQAAAQARHPGYGHALQWHRWFEEANGSDEERAKHLARGALLPLGLDTRFEVAVLLRLIEGFRDALSPAEWTFECSAIISGRREVARFLHGSGAAIEVVFNQAVFPTRARDQLLKRYLGANSMRPDIIVVVTRPNEEPSAVAIEVKRTTDEGYMRQGLEEALFYRYELDAHLIESPKCVLVAEGAFRSQGQHADEIIAVTWAEWPSGLVLDAVKREALAHLPPMQGPAPA